MNMEKISEKELQESYYKILDKIVEEVQSIYSQKSKQIDRVNEMLSNGTLDIIKIMCVFLNYCNIDGIPTKIVYSDFVKIAESIGFKITTRRLFVKNVCKYFGYYIKQGSTTINREYLFCKKNVHLIPDN